MGADRLPVAAIAPQRCVVPLRCFSRRDHPQPQPDGGVTMNRGVHCVIWSSGSGWKAWRCEQSINRGGTRQKEATNPRSNYTNRIRKAKKSHLVTLKRRYVPPVWIALEEATGMDGSLDPSTVAVSDLAWDYIRSKSPASLAALQSALARSSDAFIFDRDTTEVIPNEDTPSMQLANTLAFSLATSTEHEIRLLASRVLTNLAAMEQREDEMTSYYERQPVGWCDVLIRSQALPALASILTTFAADVDPS